MVMKLSAMEREIATALVQTLVEYGLTENLAQYGEHGTENWFINNNLGTMGFWVSGGATKACISHTDLTDWVIKVGYKEQVACNYAALEYNNYCLAEEAGLAIYFPVMIYLGEFAGVPFYLQQMAECYEDQVSYDWYERLRDQYEEAGQEYDDDTLWCTIDCMDDDEKAYMCFHDPKLVDFLSDHRIGDLHEGNFGYIGDRMVIVDFSGWRG
jgi:hypothetical protein